VGVAGALPAGERVPPESPAQAKEDVGTIAPPPCSTRCGANTRHGANAVPRWASMRPENSSGETVRIDDPGGSATPAHVISPATRASPAEAAASMSSATAVSYAGPGTPVIRPADRPARSAT